MAEELSVVGTRVPRKAARRIVTGKLDYYSDMSLPNQLYMSILRSPHAHARITSIDTSKAEALTGVKGVLTHNDVPQIPVSYPDFIFILQDKVFYAGCEVAAVVAVTEEIAEEATRLIEVEYEVLPVLTDPEEAMKPGSPEVHDGTPNLIFGQPILVSWGDAEAGLAAADHVIEDVYFTQATFNAAMENHGTLAWWDPDGLLTIWTGTQGAHELRDVWAAGLGIPVNQLRLIQRPMGGGFGGKYYHMRHHGMAALLSKKTGRPVKFTMSKEDELCRCNTRHAFKFHVKSGVMNDGSLTALSVTNWQNAGCYFADTLGVGFVAQGAVNLLPYPSLYWEGNPVYTNCPTAGAFRGYGNLQGHYALEIQNDRMSEAIGMDPIEFHKRNHIRGGDFYGMGQILSSEGLDECIDKGAQEIGWQDKWRGYGKPYLEDGSKRRAVGMGTGIHVAAYGRDAVIVKIQVDGSGQVLTGAGEAGQGPDTVHSMICAEALRISYDNVSILSSDTAATPWCSTTVASRSTATNGNAVRLAGEDAIRQLLEAAAAILEVNPEDLDAEDGEVFLKADPATILSYQEVVETLSPPVIVGYGRWEPPAEFAIEAFAAQFADVEVDVDTGQVQILKMGLACDVGRAVNKNTCENQIEGGVASQGIGMALTEDFIIDPLTGKVLNGNFLDYAIPTALDTGDIQTILVEPIEPLGPYGAKGTGEMSLVPTGGAIANAIYNAIGVRLTEFPFTPDKILAALGKA